MRTQATGSEAKDESISSSELSDSELTDVAKAMEPKLSRSMSEYLPRTGRKTDER